MTSAAPGRSVIIAIALAIGASSAIASPPGASALPPIADRAKSPASLQRADQVAKTVAAAIESAPSGDDPAAKLAPVIAELRAAIRAEPASIASWTALANAYDEASQRDQLMGVLDALRTSACDDCIGYLLDLVRHDDEHKLPADFRASIHGRTSKLTPAAHAVLTFDRATMAPFLGGGAVAMVGAPRQRKLATKRVVEAWFADIVDAFGLTAGGLGDDDVLSCGDRCCHLIRRRDEGDTSWYVDELCFAPGPILTSMRWHVG